MKNAVFASKAWFSEAMLYAQLADGREVGVPLDWFPKLRDASETDRQAWRFIGKGQRHTLGKLRRRFVCGEVVGLTSKPCINMENFEEKLKAQTEAFKAKIASLITEVDEAVVKTAKTAQAFKDFAEELHQEKLEKLKTLKEQNV